MIFILLSCLFLTTTVEANKKNSAMELIRQSPLGDHSHVYVYDFIVEFLLKNEVKKSEALDIINIEKINKASGETYKPYAASVVETQFSNIIQSLCRSNIKCAAVALYDRGGFVQAIGISDFENISDDFYTLSINDKRLESFINNSQSGPIEVELNKKLTSIILPIYYNTKDKISTHIKESKESIIIGFIKVFRYIN